MYVSPQFCHHHCQHITSTIDLTNQIRLIPRWKETDHQAKTIDSREVNMANTNPTQLFSVEGMVVVITGGGTGIGLLMTKAFALNGAKKVYIVGRRKEKLEEAAKLSPTNIVPIVGDVTSKESLVSIAETIKNDVGYVNLVCCNSGTMPKPVGIKPAETTVAEYARKALELDPQDWNNTFATNTTSIAFTTFAFLELLDAGNKQAKAAGRPSSQVLVTSSIGGYLRAPGSNMAYCASKAAATHLVKHLAGTLATFSVRINGLAPGLFPTELAGDVIAAVGAKGDPQEEGSISPNIIPATRVGREEDMVGTVMYLASAAGAYLNGNVTVLDGGRVSQLPGTY
jgi:NAD(P)-dependent dehydrogenase (short-subunit alcohol dehydrogenase family)